MKRTVSYSSEFAKYHFLSFHFHGRKIFESPVPLTVLDLWCLTTGPRHLHPVRADTYRFDKQLRVDHTKSNSRLPARFAIVTCCWPPCHGGARWGDTSYMVHDYVPET